MNLARQIGFLSRALHLLGAPGVGLGRARMQLGLHLQCNFQRGGRHQVDQQFADCPVDSGSGIRWHVGLAVSRRSRWHK